MNPFVPSNQHPRYKSDFVYIFLQQTLITLELWRAPIVNSGAMPFTYSVCLWRELVMCFVLCKNITFKWVATCFKRGLGTLSASIIGHSSLTVQPLEQSCLTSCGSYFTIPYSHDSCWKFQLSILKNKRVLLLKKWCCMSLIETFSDFPNSNTCFCLRL